MKRETRKLGYCTVGCWVICFSAACSSPQSQMAADAAMDRLESTVDVATDVPPVFAQLSVRGAMCNAPNDCSSCEFANLTLCALQNAGSCQSEATTIAQTCPNLDACPFQDFFDCMVADENATWVMCRDQQYPACR